MLVGAVGGNVSYNFASFDERSTAATVFVLGKLLCSSKLGLVTHSLFRIRSSTRGFSTSPLPASPSAPCSPAPTPSGTGASFTSSVPKLLLPPVERHRGDVRLLANRLDTTFATIRFPQYPYFVFRRIPFAFHSSGPFFRPDYHFTWPEKLSPFRLLKKSLKAFWRSWS